MYSIEEALKEQIKYCKEYPHYGCGIYIKRLESKNLIADEMYRLLVDDADVGKFINGRDRTEVYFNNGNFIRIIPASTNARGYKNNGVIIDNEIEIEIVNCIIMPSIIPRWLEEFEREPWEEVKKRIFYCSL